MTDLANKIRKSAANLKNQKGPQNEAAAEACHALGRHSEVKPV
jgi:hypothetical protein